MDFGAGCGVEALAAKMAGASEVLAVDIDPLSENAEYRKDKRPFL